MGSLFWIILFSLLGSAGAVVTAGFFLLIKKTFQEKVITGLIAYAAGALLSVAFLELLPEALGRADTRQILTVVLIGIIFFSILEKMILWRHCHDADCEEHQHAGGTLILAGDSFHNLVDGIIIASSFVISIPLGIAVGVSVIIHEIAQEIGDFGILLHSGYSPQRAILYNLISGLFTLPSALITYYYFNQSGVFLPWVMALSSASFVYIALADLMPELHRRENVRHFLKYLGMMIFGCVSVFLMIKFLPGG